MYENDRSVLHRSVKDWFIVIIVPKHGFRLYIISRAVCCGNLYHTCAWPMLRFGTVAQCLLKVVISSETQ